MKPTSLQTRERIRASQEKALDDILLAHEKDGREFGFATYGGPILNEGDALQPYDAMLVGALGKTEPSQLRAGKNWTAR